ncbi:amidohydrolase [Rossellomorea aquimaris]|uniref:M20 metallopeptidase family protein n=1 Tax=Rossellomorea aquimaris TaxID=189382 RepID=UPI001CD65919|nr:amidohydrolase [Rossellomorea aquimaris]MCA1061415.1 amidohydrolase [Rossellomorea aquimaris]
MELKQLVQSVENEVIDMRRHLHQYPEVSGEEYETSKTIQKKLSEAGIPFKTGYAKTGVLGIIQGEKPGGTIALRADIDALPIQEENDLPYKSTIQNKMHACGHDAHTSMLIGTGKVLHQLKSEIAGTILLVFQPAEENAPVGGSQQMMDDGVFDEYTPDVIFGQHVWPDLPVGEVGVVHNEIMGASDRFKITVKGSGGHASMPHQSNDAIIIANNLITQLQTIVSRNTDPIDSAVLTIGKIEGGYRYNVIADEVNLEGTIRTFKPEVKEMVKNRFYSIVEGIGKSFDAQMTIEYLDGYPATINSPQWADEVRNAARKVLGEDATPTVSPSLGGEDFSRFLQKYPGAFYWLGTSVKDSEPQYPLHDPRFKLDERALSKGVEVMSKLALDTLKNLNKEETRK